MMWGYGGGAIAWWMVVVDVLFAALVIAGIVAVALLVSRELGEKGRNGSNARQILEERFARGEIDEEEFRRKSQSLSSHPGHA